MTDRVATACEQCGQTDDHPKAHVGPQTFHHDCLSADHERQIKAGVNGDVAGKIIDACKDGKRGPALLKHIESLHK